MNISPEDIVIVYEAANAPEAHVVRGMLDDAGINAHVVDEQQPFGGIPSVGAPAVVVHLRDKARALELIQQYEESRQEIGDDEGEDWSE